MVSALTFAGGFLAGAGLMIAVAVIIEVREARREKREQAEARRRLHAYEDGLAERG